jgi:hypothetical protein
MKNMDAVRAALPDELILLADVMPLLGFSNLYEANKMARAGKLPVVFFKLRESTHAPWVATRKDWNNFIHKRSKAA